MTPRHDALTHHESIAPGAGLGRSLRARMEEALRAFDSLATNEIPTTTEPLVSMLLVSLTYAVATELVKRWFFGRAARFRAAPVRYG